MNFVCSIGGLLTLIFLLIITFDQTGLVNFVYIVFCLYHIFNFRKFLKHEEYTLPKHLKYIKVFIYIDLLINIIYQVPLTELHKGDGENSWQKVIGVFSFSYISKSTKELEFKNVGVIVTKAIMFCLVLLLDNLVKSPTYQQFINEKLTHFKEIAMSKARCLTFMYNNNKLRKIIKIQYEKDGMIQKIRLMKKQLHLWNKKYFNSESMQDVRQNTFLSLMEKQNKFDPKRTQQTFDYKMEKMEDRKEDLLKTDTNIFPGVDKDFELISERSSYVDINPAPKDLNKITPEEEEFLLDDIKKQELNWLTRLMNWVKRKYSNQMLLISSGKRLRAIEAELKTGKHKVNTTLENMLLLNHYLQHEQNKERIKQINRSMPARCNYENLNPENEQKKGFNRFQASTILGVIVSNSSIL